MNRGDDEIWNTANTIYLYAALSEKVKEKQREIMKQAEILLHERKKIKIYRDEANESLLARSTYYILSIERERAENYV